MDGDQTDTLAFLKSENARLIALLETHGIEWRLPPEPAPASSTTVEGVPLSTSEKLTLFRGLFQGRSDVYPVRWESKSSGKAGYSPACSNEWLDGICIKPRGKCADCDHRLFIPLTDTVIFNHLAGRCTLGVYPLLPDDTCHLLAVDFDKQDSHARRTSLPAVESRLSKIQAAAPGSCSRRCYAILHSHI